MQSIIISGLPVVGKTTVARAIANKFNLKLYSGGDILKEMAVAKGYSVSGGDWWDRKQGIDFLSERRSNPDFDRKVDERLLQLARDGGVVITSYTLPWLAPSGIKFWLGATRENRARRMVTRDGITYEQALKIVTMRDEENRNLYAKLYNIRFGEDLSVFDYVINTDLLSVDAVTDVVNTVLKHLLR